MGKRSAPSSRAGGDDGVLGDIQGDAVDAVGDSVESRRHDVRDIAVNALHPEYRDDHEVQALVAHVVAELQQRHRRSAPIDDAPDPPRDLEVARLTSLAVASDLDGALKFVDELHAAGRTPTWIAQQLLVAVGEHLGVQWEDDRLSFVEVTVAAGVLQRLALQLHADDAPRLAADSGRGLVLLSCLPFEQHSLGLYVLAHALREHGWAVHLEPRMTGPALAAFVAQGRPQAVGFAVADLTPSAIRELDTTVRAIRGPSPTPFILLGGPVDASQVAGQLEVAYAPDAATAVKLLDDASA
ncbi:MAG: cobalamin B12-binding domain-containing protein [Myxococcota bacterium]